mgnify:CR=1 FL=1
MGFITTLTHGGGDIQATDVTSFKSTQLLLIDLGILCENMAPAQQNKIQDLTMKYSGPRDTVRALPGSLVL